MAGELSWDHALRDIPDTGLSATRQAAPDELDRIARVLDLIACSSLAVTYTITPVGSDRYRLTGRLEALLQQSCVVTLEPVEARIEETIDVTYWPEADMPPPSGGELDLDEESEPEPIVDGLIDVGRVAFECLAAAIDLFPRKADAALDRAAAGPAQGADDKPESPFAVLAKIKEKD